MDELYNKIVVKDLVYELYNKTAIEDLKEKIKDFPQVKKYNTGIFNLSFKLKSGFFIRFSHEKNENSKKNKLTWARYVGNIKPTKKVLLGLDFLVWFGFYGNYIYQYDLIKPLRCLMFNVRDWNDGIPGLDDNKSILIDDDPYFKDQYKFNDYLIKNNIDLIFYRDEVIINSKIMSNFKKYFNLKKFQINPNFLRLDLRLKYIPTYSEVSQSYLMYRNNQLKKYEDFDISKFCKKRLDKKVSIEKFIIDENLLIKI